MRELIVADSVRTGGSSGIGKATAELCTQLGARVIIGDLNRPSTFEDTENLKFLNVDVSIWESIRDFFAQAEAIYGKIDHVFANAGVGPTTSFLDHSLDDAGNLVPPNLRTINVNLIGPLYTLWLATYYLQKNAQEGKSSDSSIVLSGSASSFQNFRMPDYTVAKHGVLGMVRGMVARLEGKVRLNAVTPSWTDTGLVPTEPLTALGVNVQDPSAAARSVVLLFADEKRHGDVIYSRAGQYWEINRAEGGLLSGAAAALGDAIGEDAVLERLAQYSSVFD